MVNCRYLQLAAAACSAWMASACNECMGKTGAELEQCEAEQDANKSSSDSEISNTDDTAVNCINKGTLGSSTKLSGKLGRYEGHEDTSDWYCIDLPAPAKVSIAAAAPSKGGDYTLDLLSAADMQTSLSSWRGAESKIADADINSGPNLIQVKTTGNCCGYERFEYQVTVAMTPYDTLAAEPQPDPGDQATQASELSVDGSKFVKVGGFVGVGDPADFYRIVVGGSQHGTVQLNAVGQQTVKVAIFADSPTPTEPLIPEKIATKDTPGTLGPMNPGTYLIQVKPNPPNYRPGGGVYELTVGMQ